MHVAIDVVVAEHGEIRERGVIPTFPVLLLQGSNASTRCVSVLTSSSGRQSTYRCSPNIAGSLNARSDGSPFGSHPYKAPHKCPRPRASYFARVARYHSSGYRSGNSPSPGARHKTSSTSARAGNLSSSHSSGSAACKRPRRSSGCQGVPTTTMKPSGLRRVSAQLEKVVHTLSRISGENCPLIP